MGRPVLKACSRCGGEFDVRVAFRKNHALYISSASGRHAICIGCEQAARDERKQKDRWQDKARDTIRRHADKYIKVGMATDRRDFEQQYGWHVARVAHDLKHSYSNGCIYCRRQYGEMGHGLYDITIDIINRDQPPHYAVNARTCCQTCNREKGKTASELWGAKLAYYDHWERRQTQMSGSRYIGPLFSWAEAP